ncbi:MAG: NUDIX hydrolase [Bdellovibrionales bacterium]|nr:NUDIX hydrolase [Bdellovibrionales bacterium]
MSRTNPWKTLHSRMIYQNSWIAVREDAVIRPDGAEGIYGVVEARPAIGILALTPEEGVYLVGQYRYPTNHYSWEIIEGGGDPAEDALQTARRELEEEAGLLAASWNELGGEVHLSNCFSAEVARFFIATDLSSTTAKPDGTEVLDVRCVPFQHCLDMVHRGEITDAMSIIALLRLDYLARTTGWPAR